MSVIHTVEQEKQDVVSNKMDATIKDGALMDKCGWFCSFLLIFSPCFSTRQVQEAEWNQLVECGCGCLVLQLWEDALLRLFSMFLLELSEKSSSNNNRLAKTLKQSSSKQKLEVLTVVKRLPRMSNTFLHKKKTF